MTEHVFADVNLPFHVWVKEGSRWVLRERGDAQAAEALSYRGEMPRRGGRETPPLARC